MSFSCIVRMNYTLASQVLCDAMKCLFNIQNDIKTLKKWMAEVDVFLKEEWPALGDSEALEKQLEQCTVSITCLLGSYSVLLYDLSLYRSYTNDYNSLKEIDVERGLPSAVCLNLLHVLGLKENSVKNMETLIPEGGTQVFFFMYL